MFDSYFKKYFLLFKFNVYFSKKKRNQTYALYSTCFFFVLKNKKQFKKT